MKLIHIVGARPNFMKVAPVYGSLATYPKVQQMLVHTGQHYDANMSDIFFQQLGMPRPDVNLEVGSGSHAAQTAQVMMRFEEVVLKNRPDIVLVYGDVNSTVAAALVCSKLTIPVAHVEAGLRSYDRTMPEEINRLLTDQIAELLFTPSLDGNENLAREGIAKEKVHFVGNVMIDTLVRLLAQAKRPELPGVDGKYVLVTLHRPSNVDDPEKLRPILEALAAIGKKVKVVFPVHPRTRQKLLTPDLRPLTSDFCLTEPLGYLEFLALQRDALALITDSGGVQEETTYLGVPCFTLRENTERPVTITEGTNVLIGRDMDRLLREFDSLHSGNARKGRVPDLWDGKAGERIAEILLKWHGRHGGRSSTT
ncbi:MAG: UDP-N-acetylglucosamine 2-epimerase (non-hydrolyzing), partial [Verrucomicrobiota bacterium]